MLQLLLREPRCLQVSTSSARRSDMFCTVQSAAHEMTPKSAHPVGGHQVEAHLQGKTRKTRA